MTWKGKHPVVKLVTQTYETGVKLTKKAMSAIEKQVERLTNSAHEKFSNLGKCFIGSHSYHVRLITYSNSRCEMKAVHYDRIK